TIPHLDQQRKLTGKMKSQSELVISTLRITLEKIQDATSFVRKALNESSSDFSVLSFGGTYGASARFTVVSNWLSMSACAKSNSSITVSLPSFAFSVLTEGSASALSAPFVPHDTSCQLQNAYTLRMLVKDGMSSRYCGKLVNMCQGSMYRKDATKYRPNV